MPKPSEHVITTAEMDDNLNPGVLPPLDDITIEIKCAWTSEKLHVFVKVIDDTLNIDETEMDNGWMDDDLEIIMDADHSGTYTGGDPRGGGYREDHQQYTFHIPILPDGYPQIAYLRWMQDPVMQWAVESPHCEAAVHVDPPGAGHLSTDVTVGYEIRMSCFDCLSRDGFGASTPHVFGEGQVIGMGVSYNEADSEDRTHQLSTNGQELGAHDATYTSEFEMQPCPPPVSVELSSFAALVEQERVILHWTTGSETENLGYHVHRCLTEEGEYEKLTVEMIKGAGSSRTTQTYQFVDKDVQKGKVYFYKLEQIDFDGTREMHGPVAVAVTGGTAVKPSTWGLIKSLLK